MSLLINYLVISYSRYQFQIKKIQGPKTIFKLEIKKNSFYDKYFIMIV